MIGPMPGAGGTRSPEGCVRDLVDAHFAGRIAPVRERRMRDHLPDCASCRHYYEKHLVLASLDPRAPSAHERIAVGLGIAPTVAPSSRSKAWALAAAIAAVAIVFSLTRSWVDRSAFTPRGVPGDRKPELFVYRMQPVEPLGAGSTAHRGEDLAFAYSNPTPFRRLLVFGVDEHKHVYWYYPAWSNAAEDPRAVAIEGGAPGVHELREAIRHDLDGDRLTLYAEFLNDDVGVRTVEDLVARAHDPGAPLPLPGAYEQRIPLVLER